MKKIIIVLALFLLALPAIHARADYSSGYFYQGSQYYSQTGPQYYNPNATLPYYAPANYGTAYMPGYATYPPAQVNYIQNNAPYYAPQAQAYYAPYPGNYGGYYVSSASSAQYYQTAYVPPMPPNGNYYSSGPCGYSNCPCPHYW